MKNLLKSSVSVAVLLSQFATFGPVYAGAGMSRAKSDPNEEKSVTSFSKNTKSKKSKKLHSYSIVTSQSADVWKVIENSGDILKLIFPYTGFDAETTKNMALVSKNWHETVKKAKGELRNQVMAPNMDLKTLKQLLVHPSLCTLGQDLLLSEFSCNQIYKNNNNRQNATVSPEFIGALQSCAALTEMKLGLPENSILSDDLTYHTKVCKYFSQLNPLDYKATALAVYALQQNPMLQTFLEGFLAQDPIDAAEFTALAENVKNHDRLKKHLMTLKLLTLSGHKDAQQRLRKIEDAILRHQNPQTVEPSLWTPYMVGGGYNSLLANDFRVLGRFQENANVPTLNNLAPLEAFGNHLGALAPIYDFNTTYEYNPQRSFHSKLYDFYKMLDDWKYLLGHQNVVQGQLDFLEDQLQSTKPNDVHDRIDLAFHYFDLDHYQKARKILEETDDHHMLNWAKAELILAQNDVEKFPIAIKNLQLAQGKNFRMHKGDELQYYICEVSWVALKIYQGEFDDALWEKLTRINSEATNSQFRHNGYMLKGFLAIDSQLIALRSLLKALKTKHSDMPIEFKEFFRDRLKDEYNRHSDDLYESDERFLCEYEEVFQSLLEEKPDELKVFNQTIEAIKQKYQPVMVKNNTNNEKNNVKSKK